MEFEDKVKLLAKVDIYGIKKLIKIGDSNAIIIPKHWLDMCATVIDGDFYLTVEFDGNRLIFSSVNPETIADINFPTSRETG